MDTSKPTQQTPRGIRNHNPGNIKRKGAQWIGLADEQDDPTFLQFVDPRFGVRAMARIMQTYYNVHGLRCVEDIIRRWAPTSENDTDAYVDAVCNAMSVPKRKRLDVLHDKQLLGKLLRAIIHHENGEQPYADNVIADGIELA